MAQLHVRSAACSPSELNCPWSGDAAHCSQRIDSSQRLRGNRNECLQIGKRHLLKVAASLAADGVAVKDGAEKVEEGDKNKAEKVSAPG